jgi:hypothetical protein
LDDPANDAAVELLLQLNHPGVNLQDLLDLVAAAKQWNDPAKRPEPEPVADSPGGQSTVEEADEKRAANASVDTAVLKSDRAKPGAGDTTAEGGESEPPGGEGTSGTTAGASPDQTEKTDTSESPAKAGDEEGPSSENANETAPPAEETEEKGENVRESGDAGEPALKDDPRYQKYFKMRKMGIPDGAVRHAMQKDEVDPSILDLDPEKSLSSQREPSGDSTNADGAEEKDEGTPGDGADVDPPLRDDPKYQKYFKMLKMGLPDGAVRNAMQRDEVDPSVLDLDPEKSFKSQQKAEAGDAVSADDGPPLKDDPAYQKYFKMLKMGLPDGAVRHAMQKDGIDPSILDLDPEKSLRSQSKKEECGDADTKDGAIPLKDDPAYQKYFKMLKMGLPDGAVRNAMRRDGVDDSVLGLDPEKSLKSQTMGVKEADDGLPLKDDPSYQKYFKMRQMGLPDGAVRNAMQRDGVDASVLDLDPERSLKAQSKGKVKVDDDPPLKEDPEWTKYFKMLAMGLPLGAVKNAAQRDGKDPAILDLDHSKSIASQMAPGSQRSTPQKKKRVRRKKIFWTPLDSNQIKEDSLWSSIRGSIQMSSLKYDAKEFEDLFTESAEPADRKKARTKKSPSPAKKTVQVIDGKRSMNGDIILKRLKLDYKKIAVIVDNM